MGGVAVGGGPPGAIGCAICAGGAPPHIPNGGPGIPYPGSTGGVGNTIGCAGCGGGNGIPYPGSTCTDPIPVIVTCLLIPLLSVIVPTIVTGCAISFSCLSTAINYYQIMNRSCRDCLQCRIRQALRKPDRDFFDVAVQLLVVGCVDTEMDGSRGVWQCGRRLRRARTGIVIGLLVIGRLCECPFR